MQPKPRTLGIDLLWKIIRNPAIEVVAAIVVVLLATWLVIETEVEQKNPAFPVLFGHK